MLIPYAREATEDPKLESMQDNMQRFFKSLEDNPLLNGKLISDISLDGAAEYTISHGLGRTPRGAICTKLVGDSGTYYNFFRWISADSANLIIYYSYSSTVTMDLWVF